MNDQGLKLTVGFILLLSNSISRLHALMCHNCIAWGNDLNECDPLSSIAGLHEGLIDLPVGTDPDEEFRSCATIVVTLESGKKSETFTIFMGLAVDEFEDEQIMKETSALSSKSVIDEGVCYIFTRDDLQYFTNLLIQIQLNIIVEMARVCVCKTDYCNGEGGIIENMHKNLANSIE